jgi:putative phosphoesterase
MLGVISNSHGRADAVAAAVEVFGASAVESIAHCGDVGGRHVLDVLSRIGGVFVWGDRDHDRTGLMRYGQNLGLRCMGIMGDLEFAGKKIVVTHGDDKKLIHKLLQEQQYDYLLCGHALTPEDHVVGRTRVLNPGPLFGTQAASALLLDPITGDLRLIAL